MRMNIGYEDYVVRYGGGFPFPDGDDINNYGDSPSDMEKMDRRSKLLIGYSRKAIAQLELYKRIYTVTEPDNRETGDTDLEPEKAAVCAMIEAMMIHDAAKEAAVNRVASTSIGSVSVSYSNPSGVDISEKAFEKELLQRARRYLDIYRGVG